MIADSRLRGQRRSARPNAIFVVPSAQLAPIGAIRSVATGRLTKVLPIDLRHHRAALLAVWCRRAAHHNDIRGQTAWRQYQPHDQRDRHAGGPSTPPPARGPNQPAGPRPSTGTGNPMDGLYSSNPPPPTPPTLY